MGTGNPTLIFRMILAAGVLVASTIAVADSSSVTGVATISLGPNAPPSKQEVKATAIAIQQTQWCDQTQDASCTPRKVEERYEGCGQSCLLEKADQNLSMQALYLNQRISDLLQDYTDKNYTKILGELDGYCPVQTGSSDRDKAKNCLVQYVDIQSRSLRSIRTQLIRNSAAIDNYKSEKPAAAPGEDTSKLKRQVVALSTGQELLDQSKAESPDLLKYLASERYANWVKSLPPPPTRDDYTTLDAKGKLVPDDAAFLKAQASWKAERDRYQADFQNTLKQPDGPPQESALALEESKNSYRRARNTYVQHANEKTLGLQRGVAELTFDSGKERSLSSGTGTGSKTPEDKDLPIFVAPKNQVQGMTTLGIKSLNDELDFLEDVKTKLP